MLCPFQLPLSKYSLICADKGLRTFVRQCTKQYTFLKQHPLEHIWWNNGEKVVAGKGGYYWMCHPITEAVWKHVNSQAAKWHQFQSKQDYIYFKNYESQKQNQQNQFVFTQRKRKEGRRQRIFSFHFWMPADLNTFDTINWH